MDADRNYDKASTNPSRVTGYSNYGNTHINIAACNIQHNDDITRKLAHDLGCLVTYMQQDWGARGTRDGRLGQREANQWMRSSGEAKTARAPRQHATHRARGVKLTLSVWAGQRLANITR